MPELVERGKKRAQWYYEQIEKRLGETEYLGGNRFSAADITQAWEEAMVVRRQRRETLKGGKLRSICFVLRLALFPLQSI